ncbi:hypothetical protein Ahy_A04g018307 isoform B [Arachis hypogaea]|uniref:Protein FAR1-RELATED SEQUENCE n=1 Tax=Arachis hypogaea TaxID=3818 RepID=A0A445DDD3_ARAHY|nr:hypothetical protein Ahy_A04g018307 isoform B [Arachis hypogaea]
MDFSHSSNSEGEDSVGSDSDASCGHYCPSGDTYDDEENIECSVDGASGENIVGGADDVDCLGAAADVAEGCLPRPVTAKDFLGKEFATEDDAYAIYKEFAKLRGFGVRKGDVARVNGVLIRRDFFCHRQGTRHPKHYDRPERVREERLESRTDCKAKLKIYYDMQRSVWRNCLQRVKEEEFRKVFRKAIYANFEISEFEDYWKAAVESLGLHDNTWVKSTYESRASWAMAYLRGTFCAGYRTTSRCEGINAFIKGFLKSTDSILELVHSLDRVVKDYRNNEVTARFYSTYYSPVLTTGLDSIERSASKLYNKSRV